MSDGPEAIVAGGLVEPLFDSITLFEIVSRA
jgi:hypothetical protein